MRRLILLAALGLASTAQAETITFTTEAYPPYAFREGKDYRGIGVEQVQTMMADAGIDFTMDMMPWARAYAMAQSQPGTCVFATAHNTDRDKLFKWVEPILIDRNILVKHKGSAVNATSLEEAKSYIVGTQRGDYTADMLAQQGFPKIDLGADFNITLTKLLSDRVGLMPMSENVFTDMVEKGTPLERVVLFSEQKLGVACNLDVDDALIARMQTALTKLIDDGRQDAIFIKYGMKPNR